MNTIDPEKSMLEKVSGLLNEGVENLDSRTGRRLEHIRSEALRAAEKPSRFFIPGRWIVVGGLATAAMAAGALFFWLPTSPGDFPVRNIEDLEIITSQERIDFYENLDFYRWLATQENEKPKDERVSWNFTASRQGNTGRG
ncbi:MAG: hypothetical protein NTY64_11530 [Deltaproteobacteria bacterium]|nr:hypothetical protein [Deltaproteobacteria bacterium]